MAEIIRPFDTPGTYFHNYTLDKIMPALSPNGWKVLCVAVRQTWGWVDKDSPTGRKQRDVISYSQFMEKTGIGGRSTLSKALSECLDAGYLIRQQVGEHQGTRRPIYAYSLNTDYEVTGPETGPAEVSSPETGLEIVASPEIGPEEVASPKTGPAASPEMGPAENTSPEIGPATGPKTRPAASPKTGLTKEKKRKQTNNGGGGDGSIEKDKRVMPLINLAQDLHQPLDLGRAHAMVQPYGVEQINDLVTYVRQAKGLHSPLAYVFERLKTGELPILPAPKPDPTGPTSPGGRRRGASRAGLGEPDYAEDIFLDPEPTPDPEPLDPALARARGMWQSALEELQLQMTRDTFNTWLKPTRVIGYENGTSFDGAHDAPFDETHDKPSDGVLDGARSTSPSAGSGRGSRQSHGRLQVEVENKYVKDWLSNRLLETIRRTVNSVAGETLEIEFVVKGEHQTLEVVRAR